MKMYDNKFRLLSKVTTKVVWWLAKRIDIEDLTHDIEIAGFEPGVRLLKTGQRVLKLVDNEYYNENIEAFFVWILWKATHSSNYRPIIAEFLYILKGELDGMDWDRYRRPPAEWKPNRIKGGRG